MINKSILLNVILIFTIIFGYFYFENKKQGLIQVSQNTNKVSTISNNNLDQLESLNNQIISLKEKLDEANKKIASLNNNQNVLNNTREQITSSLKELDDVKTEIKKHQLTTDIVSQIEKERSQISSAQKKIDELTKYFRERSMKEINQIVEEIDTTFGDLVGSTVFTPFMPIVAMPALASNNEKLDRSCKNVGRILKEEVQIFGEQISLHDEKSQKIYNDYCVKGFQQIMKERFEELQKPVKSN